MSALDTLSNGFILFCLGLLVTSVGTAASALIWSIRQEGEIKLLKSELANAKTFITEVSNIRDVLTNVRISLGKIEGKLGLKENQHA